MSDTAIVPAQTPSGQQLGLEKICVCKQCGYKWQPKVPNPKCCPKPKGCGSLLWNQPKSARMYQKDYGLGDKRNYRVEPGKRISYRVDALYSRLSTYRMSRERDMTRLVLHHVLKRPDLPAEAAQLLLKLKSGLDWSASKYAPNLQAWDDLIEETEQEWREASELYKARLDQHWQVLRKGRFVPQ